MKKQTADNIITEYMPKIYGFAMKKAFSYEEAEELCAEIVQEVYISLLRAEDIGNLEGYIWRISEHTYAKYVASVRRQAGTSIDGMEIPVHDTYFYEDSKEDIVRLRREIAFLTKKRRDIVYSFYYEDKTIAAIAAEQALSEGTVKWHLNKARNELKEGFSMKRGIGKLGIQPVAAVNIGHSGNPGSNGGPEYYLSDKLNLNIVYSVYFEPKTKEEIAEELGMTPVFIEDRLDYLEGNGFLVRKEDQKYTTYVKFHPRTYSKEKTDQMVQRKKEIAAWLAEEYVPLVREAVKEMTDVYIPGGNRELLEAAAVCMAVRNKELAPMNKDLSKYYIKTTDGGDYVAEVELQMEAQDPDYVWKEDASLYWSTGNMWRDSEKYPAVSSWMNDTRYCNRTGGWQNNLYTDFEYVYEFMKGEITDTPANAEKFNRLRERGYITKDNKVAIMVSKGDYGKFFDRLPEFPEHVKKKCAEVALETAMISAKDYPPQMQDLMVTWGIAGFFAQWMPVMVLEVLYENGTFRKLTEEERVTANLLMFSDILPE